MKLTTKLLKKLIKEELKNLKESTFVFGNKATMPGNTTADRIQSEVAIIWNNEERIGDLESRINELRSVLDQNPEQTTQWKIGSQIKEIEGYIDGLFAKNTEARKKLEDMGTSYEVEVEKY